MTPARRLLILAGTAALLGCAGCGAASRPPGTPPYVIERVAGTNQRQIVLSAQAVRRIGIRTQRATRAGANAAGVSIPYSAIVYAPSGKSYAFINPAPFAYRAVPIRVRTVAGKTAYLAAGPRPGVRVVTVGAEELLGVQTGVLGQT